MRFVLPLVALCAFSSAPLRADMFDITLSGTLSGSGTFTTDGICSICFPVGIGGGGLLTFTVNIDISSGPDAFDITDDFFFDSATEAAYVRLTNSLVYLNFNSETNEFLEVLPLEFGNLWGLLDPDGHPIGTGTYSVTPASVPEPCSVFLLMPIVALVGLRWRHQRPICRVPSA